MTTIRLAGRSYAFTTEDAETRGGLSTIGTLYNSRGEWAGLIVETHEGGRLVMTSSPTSRLSRLHHAEVTAALQSAGVLA